MVAKLIAWATDREKARRRMLRALDEFVLEGPPTTIPFHLLALQQPDFVEGTRHHRLRGQTGPRRAAGRRTPSATGAAATATAPTG